MSAYNPKSVAIVIPVHNEEENISLLVHRVMEAVNKINHYSFFLCFVDDGSTDQTIFEIEKQINLNFPVGYIKLTRNYGHQFALEAGIANANTDIIITMDGDLQHPPEEIANMLQAFEHGADIVQMKRINIEKSFKSLLSIYFYTFFKWISKTNLTPNAADFRLISRQIATEIVQKKDKEKLFRVLIPSIGLRLVTLSYIQDKRKFGSPSYSFTTSYELAIKTIFRFSTFPAHLLTISGLVFLIVGFIFSSMMKIIGLTFLPFLPFVFIIIGCVLIVGGIICWYLYFILQQISLNQPFTIEKIVFPLKQSS